MKPIFGWLICLVLPISLDATAQETALHDIGKKSEYRLHEWGVFTVPRDADWLNLDMLREWNSFPDFFHGVLPNRELLYRGPVTKPVIFLHGIDRMKVDLTIRFATGRPLIWWPPAEHPANPAMFRIEDDGQSRAMLRFELYLNEGHNDRRPVPDDHWVQRLRAVVATPVSVNNSYSQLRPMDSERISESFVYYDGLMMPPVSPTVQRTASGIVLNSNSDHAWMDVLAIENDLDGRRVSIARVEEIPAGIQQTELQLEEFGNRDVDGGELSPELKRQLVGAGLHEDEAQSLLDVWSVGLFETPGLSVIYRIPQETYDAWIPIEANPVPTESIRTGLVLHQHLEPELESIVNGLVRDLDSRDFQVRERATEKLCAIGGAAIAYLKQASAAATSEQASRIRQILDRFSTENLLK